jgi:glycosyl transferase family 25
MSSVRTEIVVISMTNAAERRARFSARAAGAAVPWRFLDAYTTVHPGLVYEEANAIVGKGRPLFKGELGCYSSHFAAWESLLAGEADQYIVMEDDIIVDWPYVAELARVDFAAEKIDYLRLYWKWPVRTWMIRDNFIERAKKIVELSGVPFGTQGYVITRSGAERFTAHCRIVRRPIDCEMDRWWDHGIPNLSVFPCPIMEEYSQSSIGDSRYDRFKIPSELRIKRGLARRMEVARTRLALLRQILRYGFRDPRKLAAANAGPASSAVTAGELPVASREAKAE